MNKEETNKQEINKQEKNKKVNIVSLICLLIGIVCIGIAIYGIYGIYQDYKVGDDIYKEAEDEFVQVFIPVEDDINEWTESDTATSDTQDSGSEDEPAVPKGPWYELAYVDVTGLKNKYKDVVGWLFFEDGLISYPMMHSYSNDTYLYTAYNGTESIGGSIFVEAAHSGDFSDMHTLVYGHNMKNLSMFGRLKYYRRNNKYYNNHQYFQIFLEDEILRYRIFAYQEVAVDSFIYTERFTSAKELGNRILENSLVKPEIQIPEDGKIITLSTCTANDNYRFVVSAVLVERYNLKTKTLVEE